MEYQGKGWMDATGADNAIYAQAPTGPVCQVCGMAVDADTRLRSVYAGRTYLFCTGGHKALFDKAPAEVLRLTN